MEITIETIKEIAKDIIDEQNNNNLHSSQHNNGERLALKMLVATLEHRQKKNKQLESEVD